MDNRDFINEYFADSDSDEEFLGFNEHAQKNFTSNFTIIDEKTVNIVHDTI